MIKRQIECKAAGEVCHFAKLDSGLEVYVCEKKGFGSNYAIFGTKYGSIDTEFSKNGQEKITVPAGIAHFLEHKLFEGEDGDAFTKYAVTGASANAYTSFDRTCYLFGCADNFDKNFDILLDFVSSPYFTKETVEKEQGIIGQEIKMYEDVAEWRVLFNCLRGMYHNHPVKIEIAGTVQSISEITPELLYSCYNTFYSPSNMFVCVCGDVDADSVFEKIQSKIKSTEQCSIERSTFDEPNTVCENFIEEKMAVAMPIFVVGIKDKIDTPDRSVKEIAVSRILTEILSGRTSNFYDKLINSKLINDSFSSEYFCGHGYSAVLFEGESNEPEKVKDAICNEITALKESGIDNSVFDVVKKKLYGEEIIRFNDVEETVSSFVESAVSGYGVYDYIEALQSVTAEDINERIAKIDLENVVLSVIRPF